MSTITRIHTQLMKNGLIIAFFLVTSALSLHARPNLGTISGSAQDDKGDPVVFGTVLLKSVTDSSLVKAAYTEDDGTFLLAGVPEGAYFIELSYVGYSTYYSDKIDLKASEELKLEPITMATAAVDVEGVKVVAKKPVLTVLPDKTVFNVSGSINAVGNNALELLKKSPGVVVDNDNNIMLMGKAGVQVYVDGKPSPLSTEDLAAMLENMQSDQIENIEIITNPSSKYDAEGNAGIINIVMKRDKRFGTNGSVNLGYRVGIYSKYNGSVSLNHRTSKMNIFGTYGYNTGIRRNWMDIYRIQSETIFDKVTAMTHEFNSHTFRGGMDYFLGKKSTVGFMVNGYVNNTDGFSDTRTAIIPVSTWETDSYLIATNTSRQERMNVNGNLNYRYDDGEGSTWNVDADYGRFENQNDAYQPNTFLDSTGLNQLYENIYTSYAPTNIDIYSFKIDHERPFWGGKLGVGAKTSYVMTDNIFDFYDVLSGVEVLDVERSNQFVYTENVNAGYVNFQKQVKKFGIQAGLRVEHTNSLGELTAATSSPEDSVRRNYVSLFPSAGVTYNHNQFNSFRVMYSRRINRPSYQDLNPFEYKLDEQSYRKGNAFLQPMFTHSVSLSHTYKYTLNTTFSYSLTSGYITNIVDTAETFASYLTQRNLDNQEVYTLNVAYPFSPAKWWSVFATATLSHTKNQADYGDGKIVDVQRTVFNIYGQNTFKLPKDFSAQISGHYSTPSLWGGTYLTREFWGVDVGVQRKFFKNKLNAKVTFSDVFHTMQWRATSIFGGMFMDVSGGWESQQFRVNLTYLFGNEKVKGARKRDTGLEEEQKRLNGGGGNGIN